MYDRIVVPLDGSPLASEALHFVRPLAHAFGSRFTLVEVTSPVPPELRGSTYPFEVATSAFVRGGRTALAETELEEATLLQERARAAARRRLEEAAAPLRADGFAVESCVEEDNDPAQGIITEAMAVPGTLVAMATHGRGGIGRWVLGSVTDRVLRHTECPTLVIRAEGTAGPAPTIKKVVLPLDGSTLSESALPHAVAIALAFGVPVTVVRCMPIWEY